MPVFIIDFYWIDKHIHIEVKLIRGMQNTHRI